MMKKTILIQIFALLSVLASAQFTGREQSLKNNHLLYSNLDLMVGNSSGGNLGMNFVYKTKYSVQVGYSSVSNQLYSHVPKLKSANQGVTNERYTPVEIADNFSFMIGRHFNINQKGSVRFVIQGGPGMSVVRNSLVEGEPKQYSGILYNTEKTNEFSFIVNPKIELPVASLLGFSAGPTLVMSHDKSYLSFCVGVIYGIVLTD